MMTFDAARTGAAIVSASVLHPAATSLRQLDALLRHGRVALNAETIDPAGEMKVPAALLHDFNLRMWAARERRLGDEVERLRRVAGRATLPVQTACCTALLAVAQAALTPAERARTAVVVAGNNFALADHALTSAAHASSPASTPAGHLLDCFDSDALGAVGEVTGCTGEGWLIGGSSAAGTLALIHADRLIRNGDAERCLVVAPVNELSPVDTAAFVRAGAMALLRAGDSPAQACRPFDETRQGFALAHIAAAVLLEHPRLARRRATNMGWILGHGVTTDGKRGTRPDVEGQARVMAAAVEKAGLSPAAVDYVNAHATGSVVGDVSEANAIARVFGTAPGPVVNATKAITGHGMGAAGVIEAIATLLQLKGGYCHPTPNLTHPISPVLRHVSGHSMVERMHIAISNSFAFGGISASLMLALNPRN
ncbi:polyketide beta-ketoacyl:ACP synthase [Streptomyces sp. ISID311]|nr:polyketide beta-ketoacyl:ACP synthase [Streptomyces sp. ISID311]